MSLVCLNDSMSAPLRFVVDGSRTIGQFYNSWDGGYHLAEYAPFHRPPSVYLCGGYGNFSPSRAEGAQRKRNGVCVQCAAALDKLASNHGASARSLGFVGVES